MSRSSPPGGSPRWSPEVRLTVDQVRRLNVAAQLLTGERLLADAAGITAVAERLRRIQIDPTNAVARSQLLVLWSRLGAYDPADLERLLWEERALFEHDAYIVPMVDYPIYAAAAKGFPFGDSRRSRDYRQWLADNDALRHHVLSELERRGPLATGDFENLAARPWRSSGWSDKRSVGRMLELLSRRGEVMVAGRRGRERRWDLPERVVPAKIRRPMPLEQAVTERIEQTVRSRGAMPQPPPSPYTAAPPPFGGLPRAVAERARDELIAAGRLVRCAVTAADAPLRGDWVVHAEHVPLLGALADSLPGSRTTLLSPFDNLISDRDRTELLFGFRYRLEIYVPAAKRQYGYWVMPILHGDRLIGRADLTLDRKARVLETRAVFAEPDAPMGPDVGGAVRAALDELAAFAGAERVVISDLVPAGWRAALRSPAG